MKIDNILILGSTFLTELVVNELKRNEFNLVGYVPNQVRSTIAGNIDLEEKDLNCEYDLALSIQYASLIESNKKTFNVHTGLLPRFGGLDILRHTINEREREQGVTFHRMTDTYDFGPIVNKITYPILPNDTEKDLYKRLCIITPPFIVSCLRLLRNMSVEDVDNCVSEKPRLLEREYKKTPFELSNKEKVFLENAS
tara:strand:+ start:881 stop:1471 length:591 start_codon:yes stop_codon:yes gene_type:complete